MKIRIALAVVACALFLFSSRAAAQQIFAQTGFNDQSGINSNPEVGSPYTIGQTIGGRGVGEPGWGDQWRVLNGGAEGGDPDAIVRSTAAYEGDGGLALTRGALGSTVARRKLAQGITGRFFLETRVNFGAVEELHAIPLQDNYPLSADRNGPVWRITGSVDDRHFEVFDGQSNQLGQWEDTGIEQRPGEWQNVVLDANVVTQRFTFSVDGVPYNAPDPLGFFWNPSEINAVAYFNTGSGSIDSVIVRAVPEPGAACALGLLTLCLLRRRTR